jgi:hypothetical protein
MTPLAASTMVWVFILLPLVVVLVIGLVDIVRRLSRIRRRPRGSVIVLALPLTGTLVYFILRKPPQEELQLQRAAAADTRHADGRADVGPRPPVD